MKHEERTRHFERQLARQSVLHHLRREQELESRLADVMALAKSDKCKCRAGRSLRDLASELEAG